MLVLNYPNNPTGASATVEFFQEVVRWAKQNEIVVVHDAAYAALVFEGAPLSFLSVPGADVVWIELHSTSKAFNMTGWRCGFVAGNERMVKAYGDVKDNTDSGQFLAIQHAAAYCWDHPEMTTQIASNTADAWMGWSRCCVEPAWMLRSPRGPSSCICQAPALRPQQTGSGWFLKVPKTPLSG